MPWENSDRIDAINRAINSLPHEQVATGLGFRLQHDPSKCTRCRATISMLEVSAILGTYEREEEREGEMNKEQAVSRVS